MILWKIERKLTKQIKDKKSDQVVDQQPQFQEGTYEKVLVMLKINKHTAQTKAKKASGKGKIKEMK